MLSEMINQKISFWLQNWLVRLGVTRTLSHWFTLSLWPVSKAICKVFVSTSCCGSYLFLSPACLCMCWLEWLVSELPGAACLCSPLVHIQARAAILGFYLDAGDYNTCAFTADTGTLGHPLSFSNPFQLIASVWPCSLFIIKIKTGLWSQSFNYAQLGTIFSRPDASALGKFGIHGRKGQEKKDYFSWSCKVEESSQAPLWVCFAAPAVWEETETCTSTKRGGPTGA